MNLFEASVPAPLADLVRPTKLDDYVGQERIVGQGQYVRTLVEQGTVSSLILWGPPGTGKTTLARIIAKASQAAFEELSAVTSGLADVKKVVERAMERRRLGQSTVLFVDEIHRFNKLQQDAFLPQLENGTITLIGATTENPSFEVIGPLLSRSRVIVLEALTPEDLGAIIRRGLERLEGRTIADEAIDLLVQQSAGDGRRALNGLEAAASLGKGEISLEDVRQAMQRTTVPYDKNGDDHYNVISAFIKSMRGSAVDASLYYLARMIEAGEDPKFIARRLVIFASEDIGLADNTMLGLATNTFMAVERVGMPEGRIILGHCVVALASAPKDRRAYDAIGRAIEAVHDHPGAEVPVHIRNAPTRLMKDLGYGKDYKWKAGFEPGAGFLPVELGDSRFYDPDDVSGKA